MKDSPIAKELLNTLPPLSEVRFKSFPKKFTQLPKTWKRGIYSAWNSTIPIKSRKKKVKELTKKALRIYGPALEKLGGGRKNVRKRLKSGKKRLPSIRLLVAKADKVFSLFIRNRDKKCVICGSTTIQCGHLFKRGKRNVRFNEKNCNALCPSCNFKDNFEHDHYVTWFLKHYGEKAYAGLYVKSLKIKKFTRMELEELIQKYSL